ncbi:discoidin domain-containing protein [Ferruginibacter sp. HRS2-29]|uniref:discoidin domain-containing protein n=1 Tax=Ferruginibacter sp. HRS2-29 TaxID=2487334 RepID=UPI0020CDDA4F|nr:discoidin domain-containing protein [Ferruginibacter sp. HRS2-29]MCP9753178.1 discoidin domain-containing protein [Ferruginibacter sp. HRS2-29]
MNLALNKKILESDIWKRPENATDGNSNGNYSYTETPCPNYFTLDLEQVVELTTIRFLLYDRDVRSYKYRLLTSTDLYTWMVHSDAMGNSWQNFEFSQKIQARYVRLHCLWNSSNGSFHIGEIEVYKDNITISPKETVYVINNLTTTYEISDGLSISRKLQPLVNTIKQIPNKFSGLNKEYFSSISAELEKGIYDIEKIEKGMESIRRQIIEPVKQELNVSNNIGKWSIWLGLIGGIVGIFSLLNSIFKWIE